MECFFPYPSFPFLFSISSFSWSTFTGHFHIVSSLPSVQHLEASEWPRRAKEGEKKREGIGMEWCSGTCLSCLWCRSTVSPLCSLSSISHTIKHTIQGREGEMRHEGKSFAPVIPFPSSMPYLPIICPCSSSLPFSSLFSSSITHERMEGEVRDRNDMTEAMEWRRKRSSFSLSLLTLRLSRHFVRHYDTVKHVEGRDEERRDEERKLTLITSSLVYKLR